MADIAAMSAKRGQIYQVFINIFMYLPDEKFLDYIKSEELKEFLGQLKALDYPIITKGINCISGYIKALDSASNTVEDLAVDRTKLLRVSNNEGLKMPYESQYSKDTKSTASLLRLTGTYKKAGFVPATKESPDFFCVQLDFMRVLSNRLAENASQAKFILSLQRDFLEEHLGKWISLYTKEAAQYADTDFYRGWLMILEGFIEIEKGYCK